MTRLTSLPAEVDTLLLLSLTPGTLGVERGRGGKFDKKEVRDLLHKCSCVSTRICLASKLKNYPNEIQKNKIFFLFF